MLDFLFSNCVLFFSFLLSALDREGVPTVADRRLGPNSLGVDTTPLVQRPLTLKTLPSSLPFLILLSSCFRFLSLQAAPRFDARPSRHCRWPTRTRRFLWCKGHSFHIFLVHLSLAGKIPILFYLKNFFLTKHELEVSWFLFIPVWSWNTTRSNILQNIVCFTALIVGFIVCARDFKCTKWTFTALG